MDGNSQSLYANIASTKTKQSNSSALLIVDLGTCALTKRGAYTATMSASQMRRRDGSHMKGITTLVISDSAIACVVISGNSTALTLARKKRTGMYNTTIAYDQYKQKYDQNCTVLCEVLEMQSITPIVTACAVIFGAKMWYDILQYVYFRERMRIYKSVVNEGVSIVRLAIERGALSDMVMSHPVVNEYVRGNKRM